MHAIAAKAVAFKLAAEQEFKDRQAADARRRPDPGRAAPAADVAEAGISVLTGGTDVHLVLVDMRNSRARRPAGRGPAAPGGISEPQRGAVRPAAPDGHVGPAHRHARARHAWLRRRPVPRGRRHHRVGADSSPAFDTDALSADVWLNAGADELPALRRPRGLREQVRSVIEFGAKRVQSSTARATAAQRSRPISLNGLRRCAFEVSPRVSARCSSVTTPAAGGT